MKIRAFLPQDAEETYLLFCDTVHKVNRADYSPEQLNAWADGKTDVNAWAATFAGKRAYVAEENGRIVGEYTKCILTKTEQAKGKLPGPGIHCVDTRLGRIGIPICYEIHFPEVSRVMALDSPFLLLNLIGTGMYHAQQYSQWTALARARAIENEVYVVGCSHCAGEIPLAFAYSPSGELLGELVNTHGSLSLELDTAESANRPLGYLDDRLPTYFTRLCC